MTDAPKVHDPAKVQDTVRDLTRAERGVVAGGGNLGVGIGIFGIVTVGKVGIGIGEISGNGFLPSNTQSNGFGVMG